MHSIISVAAGFYLLIELRPLYLGCIGATGITIIGLIIAFIGVAAAPFQDDLRKILICSTIANCGFMFFLFGSFDLIVPLLYFVVYVFLQSVFFMFIGRAVNELRNNQDSKKYKIYMKPVCVDIPAITAI